MCCLKKRWIILLFNIIFSSKVINLLNLILILWVIDKIKLTRVVNILSVMVNICHQKNDRVRSFSFVNYSFCILMYCALWRGDFSSSSSSFWRLSLEADMHSNEQEVYICIDDHTLSLFLMLLVTFLPYTCCKS